MAIRNNYPAFLADLKHQFGFYDDFLWYISPHMWTSLASDGSTSVAIDADGVGGIVVLDTAATDNNECALVTTNELFKLAAGKPFKAGVRLQYAEANTDDANVAFGFADAMGANLLGDNGGGVAAGLTTALLIYKVDGETVWKIHSENGSDVATATTSVTAGGASYVEFEIEGNVVDGVVDEFEVTYKIDGNYFYDSNGRIITHRISYASATEMDFGVYVKAGDTNAETVNVDWIYAYQQR